MSIVKLIESKHNKYLIFSTNIHIYANAGFFTKKNFSLTLITVIIERKNKGAKTLYANNEKKYNDIKLTRAQSIVRSADLY